MIQNVNIKDSNGIYTYILETLDTYRSSIDKMSIYKTMYNRASDLSFFGNIYYIGENRWSETKQPHYSFDNIPDNIVIQPIRIWMPKWSIDTYRKKHKYIISVFITINMIEVCLGDFVIDRYDALAGYKKIGSSEYFEYIDIEIPEAKSLIFGSEWKNWRNEIANASDDYNIDTTNIIVEITPVRNTDDYYELCGYDSNCGVLELFEQNSDLRLMLHSNCQESTANPELRLTLEFNDKYEQSFDGFLQYMKDTYMIEKPILCWELYYNRGSDTYTYLQSKKQDITVSFNSSDMQWKSWDDYIESGFCYAKCYILHKEGDESGIYTCTSNKILMTPDMFKYYIFDPVWSNNIPLTQLQMINYNINLVNKVVKNVIAVEKPEDYKANIIKPVFFKVQDLTSINVHKDVSENICLPINKYKSQCAMFYIKIEDAVFPEIGRTPEGVIFKIDCGKLTKQLNTSQYYVLNENYELISSGKYTYI